MRLQIIKECSIFDGNISGMANAEADKTARCILVRHALVIIIPGSSINNNILVSVISALGILCVSKTQDQMLGRRGFCDDRTPCIQIHIAVHTEGSCQLVISRRDNNLIGCFLCGLILQLKKQSIQRSCNVLAIFHSKRFLLICSKVTLGSLPCGKVLLVIEVLRFF